MRGRWEHFEHGADVGIRGIGADLAEAFEQAAVALTGVVTDPETVTEREPVDLDVSAPDPELLLVEWLNAIVYAMATRRMLFGRFEVEIEDGRLRGRAWGEKIDPGRHELAVEVKGATLTGLAVVERGDGGWRAECVVDV